MSDWVVESNDSIVLTFIDCTLTKSLMGKVVQWFNESNHLWRGILSKNTIELIFVVLRDALYRTIDKPYPMMP